MKKALIVSLVAVALATVSCSPLKLVMNSTDSKGVRTLVTSDQTLMSNFKGSMDIAMAARVEKKDTILALIVTIDANSGHGLFNKGNKMMIRLNDDSVIELTNLYDKEYEEKEETYVTNSTRQRFDYAYAYDFYTGTIDVYPYMVNQMVPEVRTNTKNLSYALYLISKKQLNNVITKGVKKLRVEIENDDIDMTETSSVAGLFQGMYAVIQEGLGKNHVRTEF